MSKLNKSKRQAKKLASAQAKMDAWSGKKDPITGKHTDPGLTRGERKAYYADMDRQTAETQAGHKAKKEKQESEAKLRNWRIGGQDPKTGKINTDYANLSPEAKLAAHQTAMGVSGKTSDLKLEDFGGQTIPTERHTMDLVPKKQADRGNKMSEEERVAHNKALHERLIKETPGAFMPKVSGEDGYTPDAQSGKFNYQDGKKPKWERPEQVQNRPYSRPEPELRIPTDTRQNTDMKNMVNKTNLKDSDTADKDTKPDNQGIAATAGFLTGTTPHEHDHSTQTEQSTKPTSSPDFETKPKDTTTKLAENSTATKEEDSLDNDSDNDSDEFWGKRGPVTPPKTTSVTPTASPHVPKTSTSSSSTTPYQSRSLGSKDWRLS